MKRAPAFFRAFLASPKPFSLAHFGLNASPFHRSAATSPYFSSFWSRICIHWLDATSIRSISTKVEESDIDNHSNLFDKIILSDESSSTSQKLGNNKCTLSDLIRQNIEAFIPCKREHEQQSVSDSCHNWNAKENISKSKKYQEENLTSKSNNFSDLETEDDSETEETHHNKASLKKHKGHYKVSDSNGEQTCYNARKGAPGKDYTIGKLSHSGKTRCRKPDYSDDEIEDVRHSRRDIGRSQRKVKMTKSRSPW